MHNEWTQEDKLGLDYLKIADHPLYERIEKGSLRKTTMQIRMAVLLTAQKKGAPPIPDALEAAMRASILKEAEKKPFHQVIEENVRGLRRGQRLRLK
jgi:hypothetical protein